MTCDYVDAAIEYVEEMRMKEMEDEIDKQVLEVEKEGNVNKRLLTEEKMSKIETKYIREDTLYWGATYQAIAKAQDTKTLKAVGRAMGNLDLTDRNACSDFMQKLQQGEMPEEAK